MALQFDLTGDEASRAMMEGLMRAIRTKLRERILERIEPDIEQAINAALESFKVTIEAQRDFLTHQTIVNILTERKPR